LAGKLPTTSDQYLRERPDGGSRRPSRTTGPREHLHEQDEPDRPAQNDTVLPGESDRSIANDTPATNLSSTTTPAQPVRRPTGRLIANFGDIHGDSTGIDCDQGNDYLTLLDLTARGIISPDAVADAEQLLGFNVPEDGTTIDGGLVPQDESTVEGGLRE
jgi:hypothetical protein